LEPPVDELQLRVLRVMRDGTDAGVLKWVRSPTDPDWFDTAGYGGKRGPFHLHLYKLRE
jgi:hypothetical protein